MEETYRVEIKTLSGRLNGLQKEKDIYEYVLENVGVKVMKTRLMRKFNYYIVDSSTDNFIRTRLLKYVRAEEYWNTTKRGHKYRQYNRFIRDVLWLPTRVVDDHGIRTIASKQQRWGYKLCFKESIPFWLLAEYGGPYTGREFITEIDKRIAETNKSIQQKVKVVKAKMLSECPCENCICVPTCKSNFYTTLLAKCALVNDYLFNPSPLSNEYGKAFFYKRLQSMVDHLKPTKWDVNTVIT